MSSSSESVCFLKETFLSDDPSEATSKRTDPVLPCFSRGQRRNLRQATTVVRCLIDEDIDEETGENEGQGSSPKEEREVRSLVEEAGTPGSSSKEYKTSGSPPRVPQEEEEEEEKAPQSPID
ncbi:UNVERIFIED_CONTAM: hypothetical protein Sindi_2282300 [Sesamum indicum]